VVGSTPVSEAPYRGRRVLVTGADGFIGSHLVDHLLEAGARVTVLVRPSSVTGTVGHVLRNLDAAALERVIACDVAGRDAVELMDESDPEVVFHLAADAYVERSFAQPAEVVRTNVEGTLAVLQLARRRPRMRTVVTSSSEIYGPARRDTIDEDHPLEPTSPYAASKLAADRLALSFHRTYGLQIAVIRPFNTFGPRHVYDVIPKLVGRALRAEPLVVYGRGDQSRDFTYVDDMVRAFALVGFHPEAVGRALNFGTGRAIAILDVARMIVRECGSRSAIEHGPARAAEVARLCCDHARATALLGWHPTVGFEDGLARAIAWARGAG
jgi:dTDP-glucose 4,6-dehydratase